MARELEALKTHRAGSDDRAMKSTPSSVTEDPYPSPEHLSGVTAGPLFDELGLDMEFYGLGDFVIGRSSVIDCFQM
jgi:hypothetical protein